MAKKEVIEGINIFNLQAYLEQRRLRRQHALFIPRLFRKEVELTPLAGTEQDRAFKIVQRWIGMYTSGQLQTLKETSIATQFLTQIFGEGLGYADKTMKPDDWQLEREFSIEDVGSADGALGEFSKSRPPIAVIELKDARTDLDRDRSNGRTAVQQCWDYMNAIPDCPWGIVSNFATIRLYHRSKSPLVYEEFSLQELSERHRFNAFYYLFERGGLMPSARSPLPRAAILLEKTKQRQKEVGDELYRSYQYQRLRLIEHLKEYEDKSLDESIRISQKILDRIVFVAFCEDRELLPEKCLERAYELTSPFKKISNPFWRNILDLFQAMDEGCETIPPINKFNGGLFAPDETIDALQLDDREWALGLKGFGDFDFSEEVNVEVLGHLFERSITELEKLRVGGLFALKNAQESPPHFADSFSTIAPEIAKAKKAEDLAKVVKEDSSALSKMPKSAQRKRFGIYYTPPAFTSLLVERTVDALVRERFSALATQHGVDPETRETQEPEKFRNYWNACLEDLKTLTVCDPACGSGAFLIRAYDALDAHYKMIVHGLGSTGLTPEELKELEDSIPDLILAHNLYGVDLSLEGVEITQLALWIRSARKGKTLSNLSDHIMQGNSLISDPAVDPKALDWQKAFPSIFGKESKDGKGGFDCVIGNPPWERVKVQEREFFSLADPETAQAVNAADRRKRIAKYPTSNPELHTAYLAALDRAQKVLDYVRISEDKGGRFPLTGKGDINLYMLFAELARSIVKPSGRVGILVPSGIATDDTTKDFFNDLMDRKVLVSLYDFENKNGHFEDVDRRFKFTALVFTGGDKKIEQADFVFYAHEVADTALENKKRHITLTAKDMKLLNPNTKTCPIFRTRRDAELTRSIYKRVPILIDENRRKGGNPWGIKFSTMFHQTNDAEHFHPAEYWEKKKYTLKDNFYVSGKKRALPFYEAKMVQAYDHRAASVVIEAENWVRQGQKSQSSLVEHGNPEYLAMPRWWVEEKTILQSMPPPHPPALLCFKDITSPTNTRSMIATFIPYSAVGNTAPLMLLPNDLRPRLGCCLLANLNAFILDYVARNKIGNLHLNFFIIEQLPVLGPDTYADKCPWSKKETLEKWISERVLKLTCTAEDMLPLAKACDFKGSRGDGIHIWKDQDRAELRAELDAAYFLLYGIARDDAEYILSTFSNTGWVTEKEEKQREKDMLESPQESKDQSQPSSKGQPQRWQSDGSGALTMTAYDRLAADVTPTRS